MTRRLFICAAVVALIAAACGEDGDSSDGSDSTATTAAVGLAIDLREVAPYGEILTDGEGMTLYIFTRDEPTKPKSSCVEACARTWPPLRGADGFGLGDGIDESKVGTEVRDDQGSQYTYNGWPLYRFNADEAAGDARGQGVGGVWFVIGANGEPIKTTGATTTTAGG